MKNIIDRITKNDPIAVIGVSRDKMKWGSSLYKHLKEEGYPVVPVHPMLDEFQGEKSYTDVNMLPADVSTLIFAIPNSKAQSVVRKLTNPNIKQVWLNNQSSMKKESTREMVELCRSKGLDVVYGVCPLMFLPGEGFHKFHFKIKRFFGGLPKDFTE